MHFIEEADVKITGDKWWIHKSDAIPFQALKPAALRVGLKVASCI
jgi:hypothetical protein